VAAPLVEGLSGNHHSSRLEIHNVYVDPLLLLPEEINDIYRDLFLCFLPRLMRTFGFLKGVIFNSARCHFTGPKKVSISRAQPPPTCPRNGCCPHQKYNVRGRINQCPLIALTLFILIAVELREKRACPAEKRARDLSNCSRRANNQAACIGTEV